MSTSDVIALAALIVAAISGGGSVYAVVISKRALTWEQNRDREGNEAKIEITFGHAVVDRPGPKVISSNNITPEPMIYELTVNVLNAGAKTEFIKTIWVEGARAIRPISTALSPGGRRPTSRIWMRHNGRI